LKSGISFVSWPLLIFSHSFFARASSCYHCEIPDHGPLFLVKLFSWLAFEKVLEKRERRRERREKESRATLAFFDRFCLSSSLEWTDLGDAADRQPPCRTDIRSILFSLFPPFLPSFLPSLIHSVFLLPSPLPPSPLMEYADPNAHHSSSAPTPRRRKADQGVVRVLILN